ncbi:hypothetical protein HYX11_04190 [Candidatus Woesearchaeota archaeon]|nr:hypothetical protein [Candidatus Woesearchaeota archaeon]
MKEYALENNQPVNINKLNNNFMPLEDYSKAHAHLIITCHDINRIGLFTHLFQHLPL